MGKLSLELDDVRKIGNMIGAKIECDDEALSVELNELKIVLDTFETSCNVERNGVRLRVKVTLVDGKPSVEFY